MPICEKNYSITYLYVRFENHWCIQNQTGGCLALNGGAYACICHVYRILWHAADNDELEQFSDIDADDST